MIWRCWLLLFDVDVVVCYCLLLFVVCVVGVVGGVLGGVLGVVLVLVLVVFGCCLLVVVGCCC